MLAGGVGFSGAKVGAAAAGLPAGRGLVAGLAGVADCGRKLWVPDDRAGLAGAELGVLVTGGRAGGRDEDGLDVGALGAALRPGVLGRAEAPPPLATARAAAASAGLEAPRTGAGVLFAGAGVATVGPEDDGTGRTLLDWGRELLEDGVVAGRLLLPDPAESEEVDGVDEDGV